LRLPAKIAVPRLGELAHHEIGKRVGVSRKRLEMTCGEIGRHVLKNLSTPGRPVYNHVHDDSNA